MRLALVGLFAATLASGCAGIRPRTPLPPPDVVQRPVTPPANGSIWHAELSSNYRFLDVRAHFPGDVLTVLISETSSGKKNATTDGSATSAMEAGVEGFFGIPAAAASFLPSGFTPNQVVKAASTRQVKNDGTTTRQGNLTGNISVTVLAVDQNGNLYIKGDKVVAVNGEDQYIVLSGKVRTEDIQSDNSVISSRLADARIDYYGVGVVGDKQHVPLVHRLFDWVWPF